MTRNLKHYRRPSAVEAFMAEADKYINYGLTLDDAMLQKTAERYAACAKMLDELVYDIFKTNERYHQVADRHGPLYHVEVIDMIAKLEELMGRFDK